MTINDRSGRAASAPARGRHAPSAAVAVVALALLALAPARAGASTWTPAQRAHPAAGSPTARAAKLCTKRQRRRDPRRCKRIAALERKRRLAASKQHSPMTLTLLAGSVATVVYGSDVVVKFPLSGTLTGYTIGRVGYIDVIPIVMTGGEVTPGPMDVRRDTACGGVVTPSVSTSPLARVTFDLSKASTATLNANTALYTSTNSIRIRLPFVVRNPAGCGQPPVETGYADTFDTFTATGEYGSTTTLDSPTHPVTVQECTTPGDPTQPCAGPTTAVQATLQVHLRLATDFA